MRATVPSLVATLLPVVLSCAGRSAAPARVAAPVEASAPAAAAATQAPATDYKNTVRWSTASEVDNFGFDVYRGDTEEGPWTRLTESPILGAGTSDEVNKYEYVDRTIDPTKPYFYWVESITLGGEREQFTPIIRAKAKIADGG